MYLKVLCVDGRAFHGGWGSWALPSENEPGEWTKFIENVEPCRTGYHVCEPGDLLSWLGPAIFEVEIRGETVRASDKTVVQQARLVRRLNWDGQTAASFALDCATRALNAEKKAGRTPDARLFDAVKVSRRYLKDEATLDEVMAAALAAWSAARSAELAAEAAWSAWSAARSAESAELAASAAAWSARAAASVAWSAESAELAASAAAWSARAAARAAASAQSAESVVRSARSARAEQKWQTKRLMEYLLGKRGM